MNRLPYFIGPTIGGAITWVTTGFWPAAMVTVFLSFVIAVLVVKVATGRWMP